jgi:ribokinase
VAEIVVVGSVNIDMTCYLARWPSVGETVTALQSTSTVGGKGANQAVAAARLGGKVRFIGAVGADAFGKVALDALDSNAVAATVEHIGQHTGMAFIDVGPDGRNIIRLLAGANGMLSAQSVEGNADQFRSAKVLLLQNEIGIAASLAAARAGRAAGAMIIMDPAPAPAPMWPMDHFKAFDLITPNATEAGVLLGQTPDTLQQGLSAARALEHSLGCGVIITMGDIGAAWSVGASSGTSICRKVDAIDTVAAGDCFNGALAVALAKGAALDAAIAFAMRAAGIATTRRGAIESLPYLSDLESAEI